MQPRIHEKIRNRPAMESLTASVAEIAKQMRTCIQCGTCTASCPNEFAMDLTPRQLWRRVQIGQPEEIFTSTTFSICSSCYCCTLRCPRGLPLTDIMSALKRVAAARMIPRYRQGVHFHKAFLDSVMRHGRVREMEFMALYFMSLKHPLEPFRYFALGMRLILRGKIHMQLPARRNKKLAALFVKAEDMEKHR
ncbi:MAG: heterodisulfide reductase [Desulfobacteraceae bacterium]|nr:heterodisulfide reductase [Desulfobacteraceae bacterium]